MTEPQKLTFKPISEDITGMRFAEPRFSCLECEDTGHVTIFKPETIRQAVKDADSVTWWKTCAVLCTCAAADKKAATFPERSRGRRAGQRVPVFGEQPWHINARHPDAKAKAATYVDRPDGFYEDFAGYAN